MALDDEHRWQPRLSLHPDTFRRGLEWLRQSRCAVLPLDDALARLQAGTLPPRAVTLTFDDGFYDFLARAYPLLQEFEFPATLYLSTWHTGAAMPVPELILRYLLWKGRGAPRPAGLAGEAAAPGGLGTDAERETVASAIEQDHAASGAARTGWPARLHELAQALGVDDGPILAGRFLRFMQPEEVSDLDRSLVSVQLHTHRHRSPRDEVLFLREIRDNYAALEAIVGPGHAPQPRGVESSRTFC